MRRRKISWIVWVALAFPPLFAMAHNALGGSARMMPTGTCTYSEIKGTATIEKISAADESAYNCKDGVEVLFSFKPDDPLAVKKYRFPQTSDRQQRLTVGSGMNPPRPWVASKGLIAGSIHRCVRKEIIGGACTPVLFVFPEIDCSDWQAFCF